MDYGLSFFPISVKYRFVGDSKNLARTKIVLDLDEKLDVGFNQIWCGSFLAAWKNLEEKVAKEKIRIKGNPQLDRVLANSSDPRPAIQDESLFIASGFVKNGILEEIKNGLQNRFPNVKPPAFGSASPDDIIAYAFMATSIRFRDPYLEYNKPFIFQDVDGKKSDLRAFGLYRERGQSLGSLTSQPKILFNDIIEDPSKTMTEFAIDLDINSSPNQIVLSVIEAKPTIKETVDYVIQRITDCSKKEIDLGPDDEILVPQIAFRITHEFDQLKNQIFDNPSLAGCRLKETIQDIDFNLNRSGVALTSSSQIWAVFATTNLYYFNKPFLIIMKNRSNNIPYFVMWVGNSEILNLKN